MGYTTNLLYNFITTVAPCYQGQCIHFVKNTRNLRSLRTCLIKYLITFSSPKPLSYLIHLESSFYTRDSKAPFGKGKEKKIERENSQKGRVQ